MKRVMMSLIPWLYFAVVPVAAQMSPEVRPYFADSLTTPSWQIEIQDVQGTSRTLGGQITLNGVVSNRGDSPFTSVIVSASCLDRDGKVTGSGRDFIGELPAGAKIPFRILTGARQRCEYRIRVDGTQK